MTSYEHPSLQMRVTEVQRDRAEKWLQEAYADGRISGDDFDRRIGQVISADTRKDLNGAFYGLVHVPLPSQALGVHPAYQPLIKPETQQRAGHGMAAVAHFSAMFSWIFGPGLIYLLATPGSYARREAAKAFNFQVVVGLSFMVMGILAGTVLPDFVDAIIFPLMWLGWLLGVVIGGAKAAQGEDWKNPVKKVVRLDVLPER